MLLFNIFCESKTVPIIMPMHRPINESILLNAYGLGFYDDVLVVEEWVNYTS